MPSSDRDHFGAVSMRKCFLLGFARCNVSRAIPVVRWGTIAIVLSCTIIP